MSQLVHKLEHALRENSPVVCPQILACLFFWGTVGCFCATAVVSFTLQTFSRYLSFRKDSHQLLLFLLRQLAQEQSAYQRSRYGTSPDSVQVAEKDLIDKVDVDVRVADISLPVYSVLGGGGVVRCSWRAMLPHDAVRLLLACLLCVFFRLIALLQLVRYFV